MDDADVVDLSPMFSLEPPKLMTGTSIALQNEYFQLWARCVGQARAGEPLDQVEFSPEMEKVLADMRDKGLGNFTSLYEARRQVIPKYAWAIPDDEAIQAIAAWGPVVEVCAGSGYWAMLLAEILGPDNVLATDIGTDATQWPGSVEFGKFYPVLRCEAATAAAMHPEWTLFICWPPFNDGVAARALRAYWEAGGQRVAYVGEGNGGCTADDEFHMLLGDCYCDDDDCLHQQPMFQVVSHVYHPSWEGIRDCLYLAERMQPAPPKPRPWKIAR